MSVIVYLSDDQPSHLTEHRRQFTCKQIKKTLRSNKGNKNTS